ncbi:T9SS type A sorting domain-containing protein [candidate division WOR-3 bacterium]|nr:T9SS type A sorting domain-containing protein [candidate division WOR-3 bacterium]
MNFLNAGKGLYVENGDLGYYHSSTTLYQMLGCTYVGDGNGYATGNVSHVTGESGTFVSGMGFDFPYQQPCDNYIDQIGSNGGTLLFRSQDNYGRIICYSGPSGSYRSIHAACVFGALRNGTHTKAQLMTQYMNYLTQTIGVEEVRDAVVSPISLFPNPAYRVVNVSFALSRSAEVTLQICDIAGQSIRLLAERYMSAGTHAITWDGKDNSGRDASSGTYVFSIRVDGKTISKTAVLVN